jgi:hypothetical protein
VLLAAAWAGKAAQPCLAHGGFAGISNAADESTAHDFPRFLTQIASAYSHGILKRLFDDSAR